MTLGLTTSSASGEFTPTARYDARAGRLSKVDRVQTATGWESVATDITSPAPRFAFDMGTLEVGWMSFTPAPDFQMVPLGHPMPAKPTGDHRQGFRVKIGGTVLGGVRDFCHSAKCVLGAVDALHSAYEQAPEASAGQIPIVQLSGTIPVVTKGPAGSSTNYAPVLTITGWTDRLPAFGERTVPAPALRPATQPAGTPTGASAAPNMPPPGHVPPPPAGGGFVPREGMPFTACF